MRRVLVGGLVAVLLVLVQRRTRPFLWSDLFYALRLWRYRKQLQVRMRNGTWSFLGRFLQQAENLPDKVFIVFEEQTFTYAQVHRRSSRFANVLRDSVASGDVVSLLMSNEPDFICVWFGLCKLGARTAFLNWNLKAAFLLQSVRTCGAKTLVVGADLVGLVQEILQDLQKDEVHVWVVDDSSSSVGVNTLLDKMERASEDLDGRPQGDITSNFLFIFTSGTTGVSKAACVSHLKAVSSMAFLHMCGATADDIIYMPLPLYHMSASLLGIGGCIQLGATCVLKRKFSARVFWKDCVQHQVTVVQYIGELCRYLVNQPQVPEEKIHRVRLAAGSGLRSDVWRKFVKRFGGIRIREGYGLTEVSVGFLNYTDKVGPIGRASFFNKRSMPFELLSMDPQTSEPFRTAAGRCVRARRGETGVLVTPLTVSNQFLGYAGDQVQTEKKLLRDVFSPGDVFFNTGDLMSLDQHDFLYFRDRVGDTFRWKGENVSTMEVSEVLCQVDFIQEATVYGVSVPGHEGRAGMSAVVLKDGRRLDGRKLYKHLEDVLPSYAWPRFLRVQSTLEVTQTFKQQKMSLVRESFNPSMNSDMLYFLDMNRRDFTRLTASVYNDIMEGNIRL